MPTHPPRYVGASSLVLVGLAACSSGVDESTFEKEQESRQACEQSLSSSEAERNRLDDELESASSDLQSATTDLQSAQEGLQTCESSLGTSEAELQTCQESLNGPEGFLGQLQALPGVTAVEIATDLPGQAYSMTIEQPLDHRRPNGQKFRQRFVLFHRNPSAPMVVSTTGYGLFGGPSIWANFLDEPSLLLESNQIVLEHRYFEGSTPEGRASQIDWSHLTIEQSAGDSHRIVQTLSSIYSGPWIATGHSKGGMTAIFHQRFHPEDLAGIVPYVAPISRRIGDPRFVEWLDQIGPADGNCRRALEAVARDIVARRDDLVDFQAGRADLVAISRPAIAVAIAMNARSLAWGFWQTRPFQQFCNAGLRAGLPLQTLAQLSGVSREQMVGIGSERDAYQYQVLAELGGPSYAAPYVDDLFASIDTSLVPELIPDWDAQRPSFDRNAMTQVDTFLRTEARSVLAIYGAFDPWTAARIEVDESLGSKVFIVPEAPHSASIAGLPAAERAEAEAMLQAMVVGAGGFVVPHGADDPVWESAKASRRFVTELTQAFDLP